jgi:hypothetical protein
MAAYVLTDWPVMQVPTRAPCSGDNLQLFGRRALNHAVMLALVDRK